MSISTAPCMTEMGAMGAPGRDARTATAAPARITSPTRLIAREVERVDSGYHCAILGAVLVGDVPDPCVRV